MRPWLAIEYSNRERDYNDGLWMTNYMFKSGKCFRIFWELCLWLRDVACYVVYKSCIHLYRRWVVLQSSDGLVQRGTMLVSRPKRDTINRGTKDMGISVTYLWSQWFWCHMHFEKELVALHCIHIIAYVIVFWVSLRCFIISLLLYYLS